MKIKNLFLSLMFTMTVAGTVYAAEKEAAHPDTSAQHTNNPAQPAGTEVGHSEGVAAPTGEHAVEPATGTENPSDENAEKKEEKKSKKKNRKSKKSKRSKNNKRVKVEVVDPSTLDRQKVQDNCCPVKEVAPCEAIAPCEAPASQNVTCP